MRYHQITPDERYRLAALRTQHPPLSNAEIARRLSRHPSTIARELRRNAAMHDGAYRTLEDVVWMYDRGGSDSNVPGTKSVRVRPLHLTAAEQSDLVTFLRSLTGAPLPAALTTAPVLPP